jgi:hypothetical protein
MNGFPQIRVRWYVDKMLGSHVIIGMRRDRAGIPFRGYCWGIPQERIADWIYEFGTDTARSLVKGELTAMWEVIEQTPYDELPPRDEGAALPIRPRFSNKQVREAIALLGGE